MTHGLSRCTSSSASGTVSGAQHWEVLLSGDLRMTPGLDCRGATARSCTCEVLGLELSVTGMQLAVWT